MYAWRAHRTKWEAAFVPALKKVLKQVRSC
jgi:hypothetical protein